MPFGRKSKESVNYRPADSDADKTCGKAGSACVMYRPENTQRGKCTLVTGTIRADHVCDRWEPK